MEVEAVLSNTGTAAASLAINCDVNSTGETAQISPSFPNTLVGPGSQASISFSWRTTAVGDDFLSCRILTPTQLVDDSSFGGGVMTSGIVTWSDASEDEGSRLVVPIMIALLIGTGIAGYAFVANSRED